jgi:hypothetical protein
VSVRALWACSSSPRCVPVWLVCLFGPGTSPTRYFVKHEATNVDIMIREEYPTPDGVVGVVGHPRAGLLWDEVSMFTVPSDLAATETGRARQDRFT